MAYSDPSGGDDPLAGSPAVLSRSARYGLVFFLVYSIFYGGFMAMNAFAADRMAVPVEWLGGINLAVAYGLALIVSAFVLAMVYMLVCKPVEDAREGEQP